MRCLACLLPLALLATGCAGPAHPQTTRDYLQRYGPESMNVGITMPNLLNGPVASTSTQASARHNPFGQMGLTVAFGWRFWPIRVERAEVQPAAVATPSPSPDHGR